MAKANQWSVKGVDEDARRRAREAAQAAGLTIGEWIDRAILKAASDASNPFAERDLSGMRAHAAGNLTDSERRALDIATDDDDGHGADLEDALGDAAEQRPQTAAAGARRLSAAGPRIPVEIAESGRAGAGRGARLAVFVFLVVAGAAGAAWLYMSQTGRPIADIVTLRTNDRPAANSAPEPNPPAQSRATGRDSSPSLDAGPASGATGAPNGLPDPLSRMRGRAEAGDPRAQLDLGLAYARGRGVETNEAEALAWLERSAIQGNAEAQFNLGALYQTGRQIPPDPRLAVFWYRRAAQQNHLRAAHNLATTLANGDGVAKDDVDAAKFFRIAAEGNTPESQLSLGRLYEQGRGVDKDFDQAAVWYRRAAALGSAAAAQSLERLAGSGVAAAIPVEPAAGPAAEMPATSQAAQLSPRQRTIQRIQTYLARLNFDPGPADGLMGRQTETAIRQYQQFAGLPVDGKATEALLGDLEEVAGSIDTNRQ